MSRQRLALPLASALSLCAVSAHGAGYALIDNSASGMGNAYAGAAAIAEDGSTIYFNPAGLTELKDEQLTGVLHWIRPRGSFTNEGSTTEAGDTLTGDDSHNKGVDGIIPNLYYNKALSNGVIFGLGVNVPFGMETNYDDDWVGRYHGVTSKLMTVNINPSLAWKVNEQLSFGAGISGQYVHVELTSAVDFGSICSDIFTPESCNAEGRGAQQIDGFAELEGSDFSWGYNFGLLYKPQPGTRLGFSYRSMIDHDVAGEADFTVPTRMAFITATGNFVDTDLKSSVTLPESSSLSLAHKIDQFTLLADWTYTRWSRFKELRIRYDSVQPDSVTTENWQDSSRFSIGLNYQMKPNVLLRSGLAYDKTPIPDAEHRTPRIAGNDRTWLALGIGYQWDKQLSFDLGYAHLFVKDAPSNHDFESSIPTLNHTLSGNYNAKVDILSAQLNWTF